MMTKNPKQTWCVAIQLYKDIYTCMPTITKIASYSLLLYSIITDMQITMQLEPCTYSNLVN